MPTRRDVDGRTALHRLADELPIEEVRWLLQAMRERDPVLYSLFTAPDDDEPESDDEREAIARGRQDYAQGRVKTTEEVRPELLG